MFWTIKTIEICWQPIFRSRQTVTCSSFFQSSAEASQSHSVWCLGKVLQLPAQMFHLSPEQLLGTMRPVIAYLYKSLYWQFTKQCCIKYPHGWAMMNRASRNQGFRFNYLPEEPDYVLSKFSLKTYDFCILLLGINLGINHSFTWSK
jgi:hypothetical protein